MLIRKEEDGFFSHWNRGDVVYQEQILQSISHLFVWRDSFVCLRDLVERSFCCSGPGKYHYSPERLKKTELCQKDEFHLGRRNGRRSSG